MEVGRFEIGGLRLEIGAKRPKLTFINNYKKSVYCCRFISQNVKKVTFFHVFCFFSFFLFGGFIKLLTFAREIGGQAIQTTNKFHTTNKKVKRL